MLAIVVVEGKQHKTVALKLFTWDSELASRSFLLDPNFSHPLHEGLVLFCLFIVFIRQVLRSNVLIVY